MWALLGLGNPGSDYDNTRHNVGFAAADEYQSSASSWNKKGKCLFTKEPDLLVVKPQAYMNLSGEASAPLLRFFQIEVENIIAVFDDLDLAPGRLKVTFGGGTGGHKGTSDLVRHFGSNKFYRIRVGIGHPRDKEETSRINVSDWVLTRPGSFDKKLIDDCIGAVPAIVKDIKTDGLESTQLRWNAKFNSNK